MRKLIGVTLAGLIALAACNSGGDNGAAQDPAENGDVAAMCSPSGTELTVVAKDVEFDEDCLAAPAGEAFTITLDNQDDQLPHNVSIYVNKGGDDLFMGETFPGVASKTYEVPALDAGNYYFQCDVHPNMSGDFIVE